MSLEDLNKKLHSRPEDSDPDQKEIIPPETGASLDPAAPIETPAAPEIPLGEAWGGNEKREEPVIPGVTFHKPLFRIPRSLLSLSVLSLSFRSVPEFSSKQVVGSLRPRMFR